MFPSLSCFIDPALSEEKDGMWECSPFPLQDRVFSSDLDALIFTCLCGNISLSRMFSVIKKKKKKSFRTTFVLVIESEQLQLKVSSHCTNCCTSKMNFMLMSTNKHHREHKGKLFMLVERDTQFFRTSPVS